MEQVDTYFKFPDRAIRRPWTAEIREVFPQSEPFVLGFIAAIHECDAVAPVSADEVLFPHIGQCDVAQSVRDDYGDTFAPERPKVFRKVGPGLIQYRHVVEVNEFFLWQRGQTMAFMSYEG